MFAGFPFDIRVFPRLGYHGIIDIPQTLSSKVGVVEHTDEDKISSSALRSCISGGSAPDGKQLDPAISTYIKQHGLYAQCAESHLTEADEESTMVARLAAAALSSSQLHRDAGPQRRLYVIGGPGTGKSAVCAALTEHRNISHICPGDWYREATRVVESSAVYPDFHTLVESFRSKKRHEWEQRLNAFMRLSEAEAVAAARNSSLVVETKRVDQIRNRSDVVAVIHLTASEATMSQRVQARARTNATGDDDLTRVKNWKRNPPKLKQLSHFPVYKIDTTNLSLEQTVQKALDVADEHGLLGDTSSSSADTVRVVEAAMCRLPDALAYLSVVAKEHAASGRGRQAAPLYAPPHRQQQSSTPAASAEDSTAQVSEEADLWGPDNQTYVCTAVTSAALPPGSRATADRDQGTSKGKGKGRGKGKDRHWPDRNDGHSGTNHAQSSGRVKGNK